MRWTHNARSTSCSALFLGLGAVLLVTLPACSKDEQTVIDEAQAARRQAESSVDQVRDSLEAIEDSLEETREKLVELKKEKVDLQDEISTLKQQNAELQEQLEQERSARKNVAPEAQPARGEPQDPESATN